MVLFGRESDPREEETMDRVNIPLFRHAHLYSANPPEQAFEEAAYEPITDPTLEEKRYIKNEQPTTPAVIVTHGEYRTTLPPTPEDWVSTAPGTNGNVQTVEEEAELEELEHTVLNGVASNEEIASGGLRRMLGIRSFHDKANDYLAEKKDLLNEHSRAVATIGATTLSNTVKAPANVAGRAWESARLFANKSTMNTLEWSGRNRNKIYFGLGVVAALGATVLSVESATTNMFGLVHTNGAIEHAHGHINNFPQHEVVAPQPEAPHHPIIEIDKHAVQHTIRHQAPEVEHLNYSGDDVWNHAEAKVVAEHPHANPTKIANLTNKYSKLILHVNHIKNAAHMFVGQHFEMPKLPKLG